MRRPFEALLVLITGGLSLGVAACGGGGGSSTTTHQTNPAAPTVVVTQSPATITTVETDSVKVTVSGSAATPTGSVTLKSGSYASAATAISSGSATISIPAGSLALGTDTLTATYAPDSSSSSSYLSASGTATVTVVTAAPTVTATPASTSIKSSDTVAVAISVSGGTGAPTATGNVSISATNGYTSSVATLSGGTASINVPAASLATGSVTLTASYAPDSAASTIYSTASGNFSLTIAVLSTVSVDQSSSGAAISDKLLGMNMAAWFDPTDPAVVPAFQAAGIKAVRWPGGSWSDIYHWQTNSTCQGTPPNLTTGGWAQPNATYQNVINQLAIPGGLDVALTADYGTNSACTGGGDPAEAANWLQAWETAGGTASHVTVGNENYGSWETDLHAKPNDAGTYASATATGFYPQIKAVDNNVLVGVVVNPGNVPDWDTTVLSQAPYDFVEYHFYPQAPGQESDTYLVSKAAQDLTKNIETLKTELKNAGKPNTPIYLGEIGSVFTNPGKQSWSITQGLYAGQVLGEMMNEGLSRLTWWIGFGNCSVDSFGNGTGNMSASLYGWQTFGAYNVFSDGPTDGPCGVGSGPDGTMSPTARAFQLYKNVLVNGESSLTAAVNGDAADVRAYAATHSGGTAVVLFNLSPNASLPVKLTLSSQSASTGVQISTYSKAIYDNSKNNAWDAPVSTDLGAQTLPLNLTLDPWSMNVVIIK
jgi:hypothetical protein